MWSSLAERHMEVRQRHERIVWSVTGLGGGCWFSLSYDGGKTFVVLMQTDRTCPLTGTWAVPIPATAPGCDHCVFAYGWVDAIGAPGTSASFPRV